MMPRMSSFLHCWKCFKRLAHLTQYTLTLLRVLSVPLQQFRRRTSLCRRCFLFLSSLSTSPIARSPCLPIAHFPWFAVENKMFCYIFPQPEWQRGTRGPFYTLPDAFPLTCGCAACPKCMAITVFRETDGCSFCRHEQKDELSSLSGSVIFQRRWKAPPSIYRGYWVAVWCLNCSPVKCSGK